MIDRAAFSTPNDRTFRSCQLDNVNPTKDNPCFESGNTDKDLPEWISFNAPERKFIIWATIKNLNDIVNINMVGT